MKRKVCVVVTARASYARIKSALRQIQTHPELELQLVVAASALLDRYGSAVHYIEQDGFKISAKVYMVLEGDNLTTMAKTTGLGIIELATAFDNIGPDVVVTIADRYETLATALAASYANIPVVHVQGGEVSGSIDEKVRHAVTKLSDIHFVANQKAAERVIRMGEAPDRVHVTGCPSIDLAAEVLVHPLLDFDPCEVFGGVGPRIDTGRDYLLVMQHPVTTEYKNAQRHVRETLMAIHELGLPTLWFWPNVDAGSDGTSKGIRIFREEHRDAPVHFFRHMGPEQFLRVAYHSRCIIGNSSVGIRECSFLGVPVVNIGSRQAGRDRGRNVIDVDYDRNAISEAVRLHFSNGRYPSEALYGDGKSGQRIAQHLAAVPLSIEKRLTY